MASSAPRHWILTLAKARGCASPGGGGRGRRKGEEVGGVVAREERRGQVVAVMPALGEEAEQNPWDNGSKCYKKLEKYIDAAWQPLQMFGDNIPERG